MRRASSATPSRPRGSSTSGDEVASRCFFDGFLFAGHGDDTAQHAIRAARAIRKSYVRRASALATK